jgi:NAD(P)-dependent dehydrogenase (short-subunit alcohol dehydrogenase family)
MYLSKYNLRGRIAFVTGGGRGVGLCAAEALLEAGAKVIISDIDPSLLEQAKASLSGKGAVETRVLDIADSSAVAAAAKAADERHGGVDMLIANAGVAWPDTPGEAMSDDVWRKVIDIDLNGAYWSCREVGRAMLERGRGSIVTVGSMSG